jgi:hypothetical protein
MYCTIYWVYNSSLIVSEQPEPVLKTQQKFSVAIRLLIGDKLGIREQLETAKITVRLLSEEQARMLHEKQIRESDM